MADPQYGNPAVVRLTSGQPTSARNPATDPEWPDRSPAWPIAPMTPVLGALVLGTILDRRLEFWGVLGWLGWGALFMTVSILSLRRRAISSLFLTAALTAVGAAYHHHRWFDVSPNDLSLAFHETPEPAWVRGHVEEVVDRSIREGRSPEAPSRVRTRFTLRINGISDGSGFQPADGRADVFVQGDRSDLAAGQPVQVAGRLSRITRPLNPGEFDRRSFLQAQAIRLTLGVDEPSGVIDDPNAPWSRRIGWLGSIRSWSRDELIDGLDPQIAGLASALVLGRRDGIDPEVDDAFARTGTTHLLAVSGLQLQILAAAVGYSLIVVGVRRRLRYLIVATAAIGYAILVGGVPSVTRSMIMTVTVCAALFASRQARLADALALAGVLTLVVNPSFLYDVGCQFSFLAVIALFWIMPKVSRTGEAVKRRVLGPSDPLDELEEEGRSWIRRSWVRFASESWKLAAASAVVWAVTAPLTALRFHLVSPIGVLLNIPLIPLTSFALLAGAAKLLFAAIGVTPIERLLGDLVQISLQFSESIVRWGAAASWGSWYTPGPTSVATGVFYGLLALAVYLDQAGPKRDGASTWLIWMRRSAWALALGWCVPGWMFAGAGRAPSTLEAEVLAVGHGLAVVVQTPEGKTYLYDCGKMDDPNVGRRILSPALWSRGISRIDKVFLSHADQDHYNGLPDLLDRFRIREVVVPPHFAGRDNPTAIRLLQTLEERGVPLQVLTAPTTWLEGATRFHAIHPPSDWPQDGSDNARSLTLELVHDERRLLLTGDLEAQGLAEVLTKPPPARPIDVLLAPHHGGRSSNPPQLYDWARPMIVIASQKPPALGSSDALTLQEDRDIVLYRTWKAGAVRLQWTPEGIVATTFLNGERAVARQSE